MADLGYLKEWFWCDYNCCNQMPPRRRAPWRNRWGLFGFLAFGENLLQTFRFATLPISFVSETKSGPCPTLTIRGFLDMVPSLAIIVLQGSFYPWLLLYFSGISSNDLISFCFALLPSINRSTFNIFSLTLKYLPPLTEQIAKQYRGKSISGWSSAHLHSPLMERWLASSK